VYNINGQLLLTKPEINTPNYQFEFDHPVGIYFIEIKSEGETKRFKLVKG